jgi:type I restriction enzyme S subunit
MSDTQKNKKPNVPNLRFPGFEGEWEQHFLSEYLEFKNGLNPSAKSFGDGIKFISVMDILNNPFITYDCIRTSVNATKREKQEFSVGYGDILFQRSSETLEDVGHANVYLDSRAAVFGGFTIRGKKKGEYNPLFFKHLLDSPTVRKRVIVKGAGAQHFNIGQEGLSKVALSLPSIQEQNRIAELLNLLDQRIAIQNRVIEDLKKLKAAIEDKCFNQFKGESVHLADVLNERSEKSEIKNQYEVLSSTVSGIYSQRDYFNKDMASTDNTGYKVIRRGDVVLSPQNLWMGNINYNDKFDVGIVSPSYKVFSIRPMFDIRFVASLLKSKKALWEYTLVSEQGASIVRRNLSMDGFMEITFPIPDKEVQKKIGDAISAVNHRIEIENSILKSMNRQKRFFLNHLFI